MFIFIIGLVYKRELSVEFQVMNFLFLNSYQNIFSDGV